MTLTRRKFLSIIGGGTIVAVAGAGTFTITRTPTEALKPWELAGTYDDYRKQALSYALLAPNPHNRQPWEVDLSVPDQVTIIRDKKRNLPHTDPYERQLTIGMGCFLELMVMAAAKTGHSVALDLFPEDEEGPVAVAKFMQTGAKLDTLFNQVMHRRSCKEPFETKMLSQMQVAELSSFAEVVSDKTLVEKLREITKNAIHVETHTYRTMKESVDLFRIGKAEINANPDGIDLGGPFLETMALIGVLTRESQLDTESFAFQDFLKNYKAMLDTTPNYAIIKTQGNSRVNQINAGRKWVRLNLKTTEMGLALHPVSQCLQEFEEMKLHYEDVHNTFAKEGETIQMLGRLGYGRQPAKTPRWGLETRIVNG